MNGEEQKILQKHLAKFIIEDVFNTITGDDILLIQAPNVWITRGKRLTEGQVNALRSSAKAMLENQAFAFIRAEILFLATQGYKKSKEDADLIAVKVLELLVKTIDGKLNQMIQL